MIDQAFKTINSAVSRAVQTGIKADRQYDKLKRLEERIHKEREKLHKIYREQDDHFTACKEIDLDWAVYEIYGELQRGGNLTDYLAELQQFSPEAYTNLIK